MSGRRDPSSRRLTHSEHPDDEAEDTLVKVLEERRAHALKSAGNSLDSWSPSVEGEQPLIQRLPMESDAIFGPPQLEPPPPPVEARVRFVNVVKKVQAMKSRVSTGYPFFLLNPPEEKSKSASSRTGQSVGLAAPPGEKEPKEQGFEVHDIFLGVGGDRPQIRDSHFSLGDTNTDRLFSAAVAIDENFRRDDETASVVSNSSTEYDDIINEERLPLTASRLDETERRRGAGGIWFSYGGANEQAGVDERRRKAAQKRKRLKRRKRFIGKLEKACCLGRRSWVSETFGLRILLAALRKFFLHSAFAKIGVPSLILAFILFYYVGNPTVDFMDQATASWWLIFLARQTLTLQLALVTQYVVIDGLALRSRWAVKLFGPLLTLFIIDSKGWPFVSMCWAVGDMFLLHGDGLLQQNWLFFTGIPIFSPQNAGGHIIDSHRYLRVLLALVIAGLATAIKRISVAMYFGKKTVYNYKPRLDKILSDIVLIAEVAELANEADVVIGETSNKRKIIDNAQAKERRARIITHTDWGDIVNALEVLETTGEHESDDMPGGVGTEPQANADENEDLTSSDSEGDDVDDDEDDEGDDDEDDEGDDDEDDEGDDDAGDDDKDETQQNKGGSENNSTNNLQSQKLGSFGGGSTLSPTTRHLKNLLDRWQEPVMNHTEATNASISDILSFRKRLSYMDQRYPFSPAFGPASTRDECIKSAQRTYRRLMKLEPGSGVLSFDVIVLLAIDACGVENEAKKKGLKRLFHPDHYYEIPLLAFVQACDSVYKRLRYFRASVGNSSLIDRVLEQLIDCLFYFVLALVVLAVLHINPWTLLVSISTLLVSFAFAVGPSASKYIEGILLIVARRPYDLGDRILVVGAETVENHGATYSWFVEDINLFSTTLRFAATNEVATVMNASLAASRIVNYNRSPNALITLNLQFADAATDKELASFLQTVESFVQDRPRLWDSIIYFRRESVSQDLSLTEFALRVKHTKSWQDASSILMNQAELRAFCFHTGKKLSINYDQPPRASYVINSFAPHGDMSARLEAKRSASDLMDDYDFTRNLFLEAKGMWRR